MSPVCHGTGIAPRQRQATPIPAPGAATTLTPAQLLDASRVVGSYVHQAIRALEQASNDEGKLQAFSLIQNVLCAHPSSACNMETEEKAEDPTTIALRHQVQRLGWPHLQGVLLAQHCNAWASALLAVVEDVQPATEQAELKQQRPQTLRQEVEAVLHGVPAPVALTIFTGQISCVAASPAGGGPILEALGTRTALRLLCERFALPSGAGARELVRCIAWAAGAGCSGALANARTPAAVGGTGEGLQAGAGHEHGLLSPQDPAWWGPYLEAAHLDPEALAGQLAALPDQVQHVRELPLELAPAAFAVHVSQQALQELGAVLHAAQQPPDGGRTHSHATATSSTPASPQRLDECATPAAGARCHTTVAANAAAEFVAVLLARLVARGQVKPVARALLQPLRARCEQASREASSRPANDAGDTAPSQRPALHWPAEAPAGGTTSTGATCAAVHAVMLRLCAHPVALERLLPELLLWSAAVAGTRSACTTADQAPALGGASPGLALLRELLPPQLLTQTPVRFMLAEKLLLRRTLPMPVLELLLDFLASCRPPMLPQATSQLASAWADEAGVLHTRLPLQAYMTQALVMALARLPADALGMAPVGGPPSGTQPAPSTTASLLPALLQGVSTRLSSPLPSVRRQAMRVGRAFADAVDPTKPLFQDQGDLALLPEERWPGSGLTLATPNKPGMCPPAPEREAATSKDGQPQCSCNFIPHAVPPRPGSALARLAEVDAMPDSDDEDAGADVGHSLPHGSTVSAGVAAGSAAGAHNGISSDAIVGDDGGDDADSLLAFDLDEDLEADAWQGGADTPEPGKAIDGVARAPMALRPLAAALRKHDDVTGTLEALKRVEILIRAQPDELRALAPELARSLLYCRVPDWADAEAVQPGDEPEVQRRRALGALLSTAPLEAGNELASEIYSPHLDQHQRFLILDSMCAAAHELADPRGAPRLELKPGSAPKLVPPALAPHHVAAALPSTTPAPARGLAASAGGAPQHEGAGGGSLMASKTRIWGKVALEKARQREAAACGTAGGQQRTWRNHFAPIATRWAAALLRECDVRRPGVDLFGRDAALLGRLLTTLGTFAECVAHTPQALPLSVGILELLHSREVHASEQPFVRRCALLAGAAVLASLPPARLAGAMLGHTSDVRDAALVERVRWLREWAAGMAAADSDESCRLLAAGALGLYAELASGAMAAVQELPEPPGGGPWRQRDPLAMHLAAGSAKRRHAAEPNVLVPTLQELRGLQLKEG